MSPREGSLNWPSWILDVSLLFSLSLVLFLCLHELKSPCVDFTSLFQSCHVFFPDVVWFFGLVFFFSEILVVPGPQSDKHCLENMYSSVLVCSFYRVRELMGPRSLTSVFWEQDCFLWRMLPNATQSRAYQLLRTVCLCKNMQKTWFFFQILHYLVQFESFLPGNTACKICNALTYSGEIQICCLHLFAFSFHLTPEEKNSPWEELDIAIIFLVNQ